MFAAVARFSYRFRWPVLAAGILLFVVGIAASGGVFDELKPGGFDDPGTESFKARELNIERFGVGRADIVVLYTTQTGTVQDDGASAAVTASLARASEHETVILGLSFFNTGSPQFISADGTRTFAVFSLAGDQAAKIDATEELTDLLVAGGSVRTEFGGEIPASVAFNETAEKDLRRAELFAFPIIAILLLVIFRSVVAAAVPLVLGGLAIVLALTTLRVIAAATSISLFALNVVSILGLGLAIDYSLFILTRYREEVAELGVEGAIIRSVSTTGKAVAFSGLTLATSLVGLFVFPHMFLRSIAIGGIAVAILAVFIAVAILPALLGVLGPKLESLRIPWFGRHDQGQARSGFWHVVALAVMRRPVIIATAVTTFLLLLGMPFFRFNASIPDYRDLSPDVEARRVSEILNSEFQPHQTTPHDIVVQAGDLSTPGGIAALFDYEAELRALPGIARVDSLFSLSPGLSLEQYQALFSDPAAIEDPRVAAGLPLFLNEDVTRFSLVSQFEIDDTEGQAQVSAIREVAGPADASVLVGGNAAALYDTKQSILDRLPFTLAIVGIATFVVLFLVFGSITLPVKAMIMNLLSLTASFGAVVFIFQDGRLESLLDFESLGTVNVMLPLLMFAIVFGLSMDYEVLMLSRVREEYLRTGDNTLAVARGLEKTGQLITSAALLLIVVIGAFATSSLAYMKALGLGMALAVAIDATIVRALLVPATMRLMGHWNWWAPGPLYALWEKIGLGDLEGHGPTAKPSTRTLPAAGMTPPATELFGALATATGQGASQARATVVAPTALSRQVALLVVKAGSGPDKTFQVGDGRLRVGRAPDNDVVIDDPLVSSHHLTIERGAGGGVVVRDGGSTNGTLIDGERVEEREINGDVAITAGSTALELMLVGAPQVLAAPGPPVSSVGRTVVVPKVSKLTDYLVVVEGQEAGRLFRLEGDTMSIGRDPRNQVVLNDVKVSGFHARLQRGLDGGLIAEDWGSHNGTYVNGALLVDAASLRENDLLHVGDTTLQLKRVS